MKVVALISLLLPIAVSGFTPDFLEALAEAEGVDLNDFFDDDSVDDFDDEEGHMETDARRLGKGPKFGQGCQELKLYAKISDVLEQVGNTTAKLATVPVYQKGVGIVGTGSIFGMPTNAAAAGIPGRKGTGMALTTVSFNKNTALTSMAMSGTRKAPVTGGSGKIRCGTGKGRNI